MSISGCLSLRGKERTASWLGRSSGTMAVGFIVAMVAKTKADTEATIGVANIVTLNLRTDRIQHGFQPNTKSSFRQLQYR